VQLLEGYGFRLYFKQLFFKRMSEVTGVPADLPPEVQSDEERSGLSGSAMRVGMAA
jgi:hypothetical protein